jgi:hypothetical protein
MRAASKQNTSVCRYALIFVRMGLLSGIAKGKKVENNTVRR